MHIIDLSVKLDEDTPVYPGDPATRITPAGVLEKDGFQDSNVSFGTHIGTHIDAPAHMLKGGRTLETYDIDHFIAPGRYVDARDMTLGLENAKNAGIQPGDIVLLHTGMSDRYTEPGYFDKYPAIPEELVDYLVAQQVKMVGVDMCSVDHETFIVHKALLAKDILIIENLVNLDKLTGKNFKVYALPVKLALDGAPARVIAEIES